MPIPDLPNKKVTTTGTPKQNVPAVRKLELSKLDPMAVQWELLGQDVDIERFVLYLSSAVRVNLTESIIDARISRTIEGASTLVVDVNDYDRSLLTSGLLNNK